MSLTEISYYIRKYAPFAVLGFILMMVFYLLVVAFFNYLESIGPQKSNLDPIFGKINKTITQIKIDYPPGIKFTLDTIEGTPVTASQTAKVYYLTPKTPQFGYREKINLSAKEIGFNTEIVKFSMTDNMASFVDANQSLNIDVNDFNFTYKYNFENNPDIFKTSQIAQRNVVENRVKVDAISFLSKVKKFPEELSQGKERIIYLNYDSVKKSFDVVKRKEDANAIEVDFYRADIDGTGTIPPKYYNSQNYVVMVYSKSEEAKIIKAEMKYFERQTEKVGVYPLKTGSQAWDNLKNGNGTIISLGTNQSNDIAIKSMELFYFDPDIYQAYLQPVYVFVGENGFVGFVEAISSDYME